MLSVNSFPVVHNIGSHAGTDTLSGGQLFDDMNGLSETGDTVGRYVGTYPDHTNNAIGHGVQRSFTVGPHVNVDVTDWDPSPWYVPFPGIVPSVPDHPDDWWVRELKKASPSISYGYVATMSTAWRLNIADPTKLVLSVDMPGIRPEDLTVETNMGNVVAKGKRFDTGVIVEHSYNVGMMSTYDLSTAEATFEASVLTVVIMTAKSVDKRSIAVKTK